MVPSETQMHGNAESVRARGVGRGNTRPQRMQQPEAGGVACSTRSTVCDLPGDSDSAPERSRATLVSTKSGVGSSAASDVDSCVRTNGVQAAGNHPSLAPAATAAPALVSTATHMSVVEQICDTNSTGTGQVFTELQQDSSAPTTNELDHDVGALIATTHQSSHAEHRCDICTVETVSVAGYSDTANSPLIALAQILENESHYMHHPHQQSSQVARDSNGQSQKPQHLERSAGIGDAHTSSSIPSKDADQGGSCCDCLVEEVAVAGTTEVAVGENCDPLDNRDAGGPQVHIQDEHKDYSGSADGASDACDGVNEGEECVSSQTINTDFGATDGVLLACSAMEVTEEEVANEHDTSEVAGPADVVQESGGMLDTGTNASTLSDDGESDGLLDDGGGLFDPDDGDEAATAFAPTAAPTYAQQRHIQLQRQVPRYPLDIAPPPLQVPNRRGVRPGAKTPRYTPQEDAEIWRCYLQQNYDAVDSSGAWRLDPSAVCADRGTK